MKELNLQVIYERFGTPYDNLKGETQIDGQLNISSL